MGSPVLARCQSAGLVQGGGVVTVVWSHSLASVIAIHMVSDIFMDGSVHRADPRHGEGLQQHAWEKAPKAVFVGYIAVEKQLRIYSFIKYGWLNSWTQTRDGQCNGCHSSTYLTYKGVLLY